jgi:amidase
VAETAQLLDVLSGPFIGDATWAPPPAAPFADAVAADPAPMRIGVAVYPPLPDAEVDPLALAAVREAAELLTDLGHVVVEITPSWTNNALLPLFTLSFGTAIATSIAYSGLIAGREPQPEDMQALSWAIYERMRSVSAVEYAGGHAQLQAMMRALIIELDPYDAVLTPALAQRPLPIGTLQGDGDDPWEAFAGAGRFTPFTAGLNASGQPAISLPLVHGEDGLPVGVQLIGRPAREDVLLALGAQIERARPWADRRPPISAA